jgi:hypothetical protein
MAGGKAKPESSVSRELDPGNQTAHTDWDRVSVSVCWSRAKWVVGKNTDMVLQIASRGPHAQNSYTALADPIWTPIFTNALSNGTSYFSDPEWTNYPARF